jgi:hypothetical protein
MTTLKCTQENRHNKTVKSPGNHENNNSNTKKEDDLIDLFPLPRYFQVHFEHIHDNTHDVQGKLNHLNHDIQGQLDQIKQTLASVESKLDRFIMLLSHNIESKH